MLDKRVKEILASYLSAKEELGKIAPTFNWSNLLGDYGEYIAINEFELSQAEISTKGYDAINKKGQTVQIKTIRDTTRSIKFKKGADHLLVIQIKNNGDFQKIYYGNFKKIIDVSVPTKFGEHTVGTSKLKKIAENTFEPIQEVCVSLKNGKKLCASSREDLRDKLLKKGYKCKGMSTINKRINRNNWELERAFSIKVPPNYASVEKFVDEKGYEWFPYAPHEDKDRIPLVSDFDKRVYISQSYFAKEYEIPQDYISDKLKPPVNWKTAEIWANYKHLKK